MSRKPIISHQVAGQTATELDIRIINMPLYPSTDTVTNVFYGYYKAGSLRIEDATAEGNYVLGDIISANSKTSLLTALTNVVGTVTKATLKYYQLDDNKYTIRYIKDGPDTIEIEGSFFTSAENNTVKTTVFANLSEIIGGAGYRKSITVNSTSSQTNYPVRVNIHNTAGTDTVTDIYLNGKVRSDWGDIRILSGSTSIPFGIVNKTSTSITITFSATVATGDNTFYLIYNRPSTLGVTKFGVTTDQHYDSAETYVGRDQALTRLDNFKAEMIAYVPDAILEGGDKIGSVTTDSALRLAIMNSVTAKHNEAAATIGCPNYLWGWGNHDFEQVTFSAVQANYSSLPGLVAGTLYGTWEDANYRYISLDAQYSPTDQTHVNINQGYGYINADQLTWLTNTLSAATKPCIVFCHQLLCEADTAKIFLSKRTYHVDNRVDVRTVLENSGKVLFVLHGHTHITTHEIINGIPYLNLCDVNEPSPTTYSWNTPNPDTIATFNGTWGKIEVDRDSQIIRFIQEVQSGTTVSTVYDFRIPYKTIYDTEYGDNPEKVFGFTAYPYNKSNIITDATDISVNTTNLITKPASIFDGDARLSHRTIKFYGLTDSGNTQIVFAGTFTAQLRIRFSMQLATLSNQYIQTMHFNGGSVTNEFGFDSSGNIYAYNGVTKTTLQTYLVGTWYEFNVEINISTKKLSIYIDGVLKATNFSFKIAGGFSIDGLKLFTQTGNMFIDNLRFVKYTPTEPAITAIGGEETL